MANPFASALDALFNAPGSEAAEHKSVYGQITRGVRIIRSRPDQVARFGDADIITPTMMIEVRKSQLPKLLPDDTIYVGTLDGDAFTATEELILTSDPMQDEESLTWRVGAEPVDVSR